MKNSELEQLLSEATQNPLLIQALYRHNFASFVQKVFLTLNPGTQYVGNWHIQAIAWRLQQVLDGQVRRLIITMPPRSLKSISASVAFPAFVHGHDAAKHIISVTYGQDLSVKLHNDYRNILATKWYKELFPKTRIDPRKDSEGEVTLTGRGSRMATSIGGTLTGRGADIIVIDDPLKPIDAMSESKREAVNEWFRSTLISRLNDKVKGAIVIVTQRVHAHDLVGHVLETAPDDWTVLNLPAISTFEEKIQISGSRIFRRLAGRVLHPERESRQVLDLMRRDLGSAAFEAQYQQSPVPPGGAMFKRNWLRYYDNLPAIDENDEIIQSWDTASKTGPENDWSVCTTWLLKDGKYYLIDLFREKLDYPTLRMHACRLADEYDPRMIFIEDAGVGTGLIEDLRNSGYNSSAVQPIMSKEARASIQSSKVEGGRVLFPKYAPWLGELETEFLSFPGSRHDDQVDSIVQALAYDAMPDGGVMWFRW